MLADGTEVWINAESRLHYPARFTGDTRTVRLEGEAYFKVARDEQHPFVVETAHLKTRVLGTEFNLQSYAGEASSVTLVTGRVAVQTDHSAEQISLMPGQELTLEADGTSPTLQNVDTYARTQWKEGYFYFDRASLEEILHGLGRWYNVDIELDCDPALLDYHLHYVANRHGTLAEALEKLNMPYIVNEGDGPSCRRATASCSSEPDFPLFISSGLTLNSVRPRKGVRPTTELRVRSDAVNSKRKVTETQRFLFSDADGADDVDF